MGEEGRFATKGTKFTKVGQGLGFPPRRGDTGTKLTASAKGQRVREWPQRTQWGRLSVDAPSVLNLLYGRFTNRPLAFPYPDFRLSDLPTFRPLCLVDML
jgi:hypothetical protein